MENTILDADLKSDGAGKPVDIIEHNRIISDYMRSLAKKSHEAIKAKYGASFFRDIRVNKGKDWRRKKRD